ncbi:MAG: glycosyltransferase [Anaerolineales bacterium]|nr:glycosyltransferase [Anaerolineales bacterium]
MIEILTIAALDWRNGHEFALQAMQILQDRGQDFQYKLVGDGDFLEATAFARHELGLQERVHIIRSASEKELDDLLRQADVFLLAAVSADGRHALVHAVEYDLPVVVTDIPQLLVDIPPDARYWVVSRRDPHAMADCLQIVFF